MRSEEASTEGRGPRVGGGEGQDGSWVERSSPGRAVGVGFVEAAVALSLEEWETFTEEPALGAGGAKADCRRAFSKSRDRGPRMWRRRV